ncbi:uncharacterized protein LOC134529319 [Bacillus rossius redtenbacheri]|uniref:uncharacterized protein LOC134529319 n=1 Tax=Bacillus rossius redtenbacheri TaxID=93214 RepID=UPI002FDD186D
MPTPEYLLRDELTYELKFRGLSDLGDVVTLRKRLRAACAEEIQPHITHLTNLDPLSEFNCVCSKFYDIHSYINYVGEETNRNNILRTLTRLTHIGTRFTNLKIVAANKLNGIYQTEIDKCRQQIPALCFKLRSKLDTLDQTSLEPVTAAAGAEFHTQVPQPPKQMETGGSPVPTPPPLPSSPPSPPVTPCRETFPFITATAINEQFSSASVMATGDHQSTKVTYTHPSQSFAAHPFHRPKPIYLPSTSPAIFNPYRQFRSTFSSLQTSPETHPISSAIGRSASPLLNFTSDLAVTLPHNLSVPPGDRVESQLPYISPATSYLPLAPQVYQTQNHPPPQPAPPPPPSRVISRP